MAAVATGRELVKRARKGMPVLGLDRLLQSGDRATDRLFHGVTAEQSLHVLETALEPVDFVIDQRPVMGATCKPELDVTHLLTRHDVAKARLIGFARRGRSLLGRSLLRF